MIVDIKLAFEGDQDLQNSIEVPKFSSPSCLWVTGIKGQVTDVMDSGSCGHLWCYNRSCCVNNLYTDSQKKMRTTIETDIKLVLEDDEAQKQVGGGGGREFRSLMEMKGMTILLPGAVPGFALRNRRWGK